MFNGDSLTNTNSPVSVVVVIVAVSTWDVWGILCRPDTKTQPLWELIFQKEKKNHVPIYTRSWKHMSCPAKSLSTKLTHESRGHI